jgi:Cof subfamily protein (haloacid dehalogenase superfamily)
MTRKRRQLAPLYPGVGVVVARDPVHPFRQIADDAGPLQARYTSNVSADSRIQLVAIDLDGTLLNDTKQVSDQTVQALCGLPELGIKVVIASARPPRSVRHIYESLRLDTWQINYNGAMIWDEPRRQVVLHQPMKGPVARRIIEHARDLFPDVLVSCEVLDRWLTDRLQHKHTTETGRLFRPDKIAPIDELCSEPVTKLLLLGHPEMMSQLASIIASRYPDVGVVQSDPDLIQIMDSAVNKASALRHVAEHYRVPMEQVMAIGDAANDIPMLEAAGVAIAMDNAKPEVKKIADWVAPSNNDHGVHAALQRYGLC